jgi:hypothetical protein
MSEPTCSHGNVKGVCWTCDLTKANERSELAPARLLPRTIDDVCNQPPGSFRKFIAEQHEDEMRTENERKERIRKARGRAG